MTQKTMRAAVLTGPRKIEMKNIPAPVVGPGMLGIRVSACGVCGSDIHMWQAGKGWGKNLQDFVMGHEFCGVVDEPGDSDFKVGERVTFWANLYCGECDMCRAGQEHLCRDVNGTNYTGFVCNGAYAERFAGKAKNAWRLPDAVSDVAAACIDPLMVAYHAVRRAGIKLGDTVLVTGNGIIGNMIGELAKKSGAAAVALSKLGDHKLTPTKKAGFFDAYFDADDPGQRGQMADFAPDGFDVAFEAVGAATALDTCIHTVKPGGTVMMIGNSTTPDIPVNINRAVLQEVRLIGSVSCTREEFAGTIDLIARGTIDPERYVTDLLPLDKLQTAFERLTTPTDPILKAVVKP